MFVAPRIKFTKLQHLYRKYSWRFTFLFWLLAISLKEKGSGKSNVGRYSWVCLYFILRSDSERNKICFLTYYYNGLVVNGKWNNWTSHLIMRMHLLYWNGI
jgi:hypothetical protein